MAARIEPLQAKRAHNLKSSMRFSRNQIIGAVVLLLLVWLVVGIRLIISRG